jgi:drug/metabolite transporter (DMT)-like permease
MIHLVAASLLWAFSFGLIKGQLAGIDPVAVACGRLLLATVAFLPLLVRRRPSRRAAWAAMALGTVQFGLMYMLYIASYRWLPAWMVAVFTIFTPLYVILIAGLREKRLGKRHILAAMLAVLGAGVVVARGLPVGADWRGVVLLQGANLCFAAGQVYYLRLRQATGLPEATLLGWMYLGAALATLTAVLVGWVAGGEPLAGWHRSAVGVLVYLGLVPTAVGFYLWNRGSVRVRTGTLAAANNLKVPLAVLVSWLIFGEQAPYGQVLAGLALILAGLFVATTRGNGIPAVGRR